MAKKKKMPDLNPIKYSDAEMQMLQVGYQTLLNTDPQYSLEVDPTNKYNLSETKKSFIENYCEVKNIPLAAQLTGIDPSEAKMFWGEWNVKAEINRINFAKIHRQFSVRMMNLDEIGGYLTSQILDYNVSLSDRLSARDKLAAARMLMDLNKMKQEAVVDPRTVIDVVDTEEMLKEMNVDSIEEMINNTKHATEVLAEKSKIIGELKDLNPELTGEDIASLRSLNIEDLERLLQEVNEFSDEEADPDEDVN